MVASAAPPVVILVLNEPPPPPPAAAGKEIEILDAEVILPCWSTTKEGTIVALPYVVAVTPVG